MKKLLIRAEDKNIWERRAPIVPADLKDIINQTHAQAFVEQSEKRFFKADEYEAAGAVSCQDMDAGEVIFGVKEIPEEKIIGGKAYLFFSHTIKGQKSGMPLLKKIISSGSTLIDYEKIIDDQNRRLIYFGRYAGDAGTIDILSLMGEYWEHHGLDTPFRRCRRAHEYESVAAARVHLQKIGDLIREKGLPEALSPLVIGIMGYGNVSGGAQQILACLPMETVEPDALKSLIKNGNTNPKTVYVTIFKEKDLVCPKENKPFDLNEYYQHPERYKSSFDAFLPYITILINAVYWESNCPRFVTWDALEKLYKKNKNPKLCGIADISCDINGSVECTVRSTETDMPAYLCDPFTGTTKDGHKGEGIVVLAVDNLPCELPDDSSTFFSNQLKPFVSNILAADYHTSFENSGLCPEIKSAVIVYNGKLTPDFEYLKKYL
jgi:alpha-aminoadipic semialdehyde synthase